MGTVAALLGAAAVWAAPEETLRPLKPSIRGVALGLVVGAVVSLASVGIWPLVTDVAPAFRDEARLLYARLYTPPGPVIAGPVLLLVVVVEELFWRGLVQGRLERRYSPAVAAVLGTAAYAVAQGGQQSLFLVAVAAAMGLLFASLRAVTRELWAPLLCHVVWNVVVFVVRPLEPLG